MATRRVRIGVVGVGNVAEITYLPGIGKIPHAELVAVCDRSEAQAKKMQAKFNVPEAYADVNEMLKRADIEAVVVLSSIPAHAELALAAIQAGKHVYIEKPIATNLADADRIIAEGERAKVKLACAPPTILSPRVQMVKDVIDKGAIGKVCWARAHNSHVGPGSFFWRTMDVTWFYKPGAGPLFDIGVYAFQELTYTLGPVRRVAAMTGLAIPEITFRSGPKKGEKCQVEVDDMNLALLDFASGAKGFVDATYTVWAAQGPKREYYGSTGTLAVMGRGSAQPFQLYKEDFELGTGGWNEPAWGGLGIDVMMSKKQQQYADDLGLAIGVSHLAECIIEDKKPLISAERARHTLDIMLAIGEASKTGSTVQLRTTI